MKFQFLEDQQAAGPPMSGLFCVLFVRGKMNSSQLLSLSWWLTAVLGALVLNLLSGYVKDGIDRLLSRGFRWWRTRSAQAKANRDELVATLARSPELREDYHHTERLCRSMGMRSLMMVAIFLAIAGLNSIFHIEDVVTHRSPSFALSWGDRFVGAGALLISALYMCVSMRQFGKAHFYLRAILDARQRDIESQLTELPPSE